MTTQNHNLQASAERILMLKGYMLALYKKLSFMRVGYSRMSEEQRNDIAIEEFRVLDEINQLHKKLVYMDRVFTTQLFLPYINEINGYAKEMDGLMAKMQSYSDKQFEMQSLLDNVKWDNFNEMSFKDRLSFYKEVKAIINNLDE